MEGKRAERIRIDWFLVVDTQYRHSVYNSRSSSSLFNKQSDALIYGCSSHQLLITALLFLSLLGSITSTAFTQYTYTQDFRFSN